MSNNLAGRKERKLKIKIRLKNTEFGFFLEKWKQFYITGIEKYLYNGGLM